jgi:hypothetical protein
MAANLHAYRKNTAIETPSNEMTNFPCIRIWMQTDLFKQKKTFIHLLNLIGAFGGINKSERKNNKQQCQDAKKKNHLSREPPIALKRVLQWD